MLANEVVGDGVGAAIAVAPTAVQQVLLAKVQGGGVEVGQVCAADYSVLLLLLLQLMALPVLTNENGRLESAQGGKSPAGLKMLKQNKLNENFV